MFGVFVVFAAVGVFGAADDGAITLGTPRF